MKHASRLSGTAVLILVPIFALAACGSGSGTKGAKAPSAAATTAGKTLRIGFFGFAKSNSFAEASFAGIQQAAAQNNATATFVDPNFSPPTQISQVQDAVVSKRFDVLIIQAIDGTAIVPAVKQAVAAGLTVVAEFSPIGGRYDTVAAQVPRTISIVDAPVFNGQGLATLGLGACKKAAANPCKVAYLSGSNPGAPIEDTRTNAVVAGLKAGGADVVASVVGGYTADAGRTAFQTVLQAHPDVNVVIGSTQAIEGAAPLASGKKIEFVGNGGSTQAVQAVQSGAWYGIYIVPEKADGAKAAELGLGKARGRNVPTSVDSRSLTPYRALGTKARLSGVSGDYKD